MSKSKNVFYRENYYNHKRMNGKKIWWKCTISFEVLNYEIKDGQNAGSIFKPLISLSNSVAPVSSYWGSSLNVSTYCWQEYLNHSTIRIISCIYIYEKMKKNSIIQLSIHKMGGSNGLCGAATRVTDSERPNTITRWKFCSLLNRQFSLL